MTQDTTSKNNAAADENIIELSVLLSILWRRKLWIAVCMIVAGALSGYYAFGVAVPKYQATSVLLLDGSDQQLLSLNASLPSLGTNTEAINTEVEVLKSRSLIERVVTVANLTTDPEFNASLRQGPLLRRIRNFLGQVTVEEPSDEKQMTMAVNAFLNRISVQSIPKTYVLKVTMETENAQKSTELADIIAEQYILYQMDVKFNATRDASEWLTSRVADLKVDLEETEAKVAEFATSSEAISEESVKALDRQLKEARSRLEETTNSLGLAQLTVANLEAVQTAPAEEKIAQANDIRLTNIYQQNGPSAAFDARFEQVLLQARLQVERTTAQVQSLSRNIQERDEEIVQQTGEIIQLQQLTREAEASRLLYEYFLSRLKETAAQEGIQRAESRVLSNAVLPSNPSEPRKPLILGMSLILGAMIGSFVALIWEMRQDGYRVATDLAADSNLPVMGQIPLIPVKNRRSSLDYLAERPTSAAAEAVRNLRTSVLMSGAGKGPKIIMSASSLPGEGKTTISFALAQNLVGLDKKVLLIEGDMRRLVFSQYLNVKDKKGIMSVLSKDTSLADAVIHDPKLGADILVGEPSTVNAADILSSTRFEEFLNETREAYDYVIIDTPPVLIVPDARIIANKVDTILFTVRWDSTSKTQVRNALHMFKTVGASVDGLVLNQINTKQLKRYGYSDDYGVYGSKYYTN